MGGLRSFFLTRGDRLLSFGFLIDSFGQALSKKVTIDFP